MLKFIKRSSSWYIDLKKKAGKKGEYILTINHFFFIALVPLRLLICIVSHGANAIEVTAIAYLFPTPCLMTSQVWWEPLHPGNQQMLQIWAFVLESQLL